MLRLIKPSTRDIFERKSSKLKRLEALEEIAGRFLVLNEAQARVETVQKKVLGQQKHRIALHWL